MSAVQLWYTRCPVPTALGLAARLGLLDQAFAADPGVTLCSLRDSVDRAVRQSHYTHSLPGSFRHGGNYPAIWAQANGADTKIIGLSTMPATTRQTILALPDSPVRRPRDLKGRRILLLRRPNDVIDFHYYTALRTVEKALARAGLSRGDVELVERRIDTAFVDAQSRPGGPAPGAAQSLSPWPATLFPLVRGEVDAIVAGVARSHELEHVAGLRPVFDQRDLPPGAQGHNGRPLTLAVKTDLIRERPDLVRRLLAGILAAEAVIRETPDLALQHFAREFGFSERLTADLYGATLADDLHVDFRADRVRALQNEVDFLFRVGAIPHRFDVAGWLDERFLTDLRAEAAAEPAGSPIATMI